MVSSLAINRQFILAQQPPEWPDSLLPGIQAVVRTAGRKVVVLDDDPTGNQTVHDVWVLTEWTVDRLAEALRDPEPVVYILTNSRSLGSDDALELNRVIAGNLCAARRTTGRDFAVISRSDSTLRGHYPGETDILTVALGDRVDAVLLVPFFAEGGRLTIDDVHYVARGENLVPAAETEYARDGVFSYTHSNLREWVSEKPLGLLAPEDVASISLTDIRLGGPAAVEDKLLQIARREADADDAACGVRKVCVVNAVSYRDLEVVVDGLLRAEAAGKAFLCRTAASFVRVRGGIEPKPLLTTTDLGSSTTTGGLVVVGSHVERTTRQVSAAAGLSGIDELELSVPALLDPISRDAERLRTSERVNQSLAAGRDVLMVTSREVIRAATDDDNLRIARSVSAALAGIVAQLPKRPAWIVAKGGITSSDVATVGLVVRRARVLGQVLPGVPVWQAGEESRWPGLSYVVFPGNVGSDNDLAGVIQVLRGRPAADPADRREAG